MKAPTRLDSLTGVRILLAMMVLFCHGWIRCAFFPDNHWFSQIVWEMGRCGVAGFFVLSGFILAHVYRERKWSTREFVVNRIARIYPLYFIGILFTLPMDWISPGMPTEGRPQALCLTIMLQQSWFLFSNGRFNGPGWTLSVEALFYTLFPLLFYVWRRSAFKFTLLSISAAVLTACFWNSESFYMNYRFPLMRVWEFMFGMALALFPLRRVMTVLEPLPIALLLITPAIAAWLNPISPPFTKWLIMVLMAGVSILALSARDIGATNHTRQTSNRFSFLRLKWMVVGGEISYGLYLLHEGVQRYSRVIFEKLFQIQLKDAELYMKLGYLVATTVASLALAWTCWIWIEIPARKYLRNKFAPHG